MNKKLIPGYQQVRKLPLNYSEIKGSEYFIHSIDNLPDIDLCAIDNAYVTPYGIVMKNWKIVKESVYSMFTNHKHYKTFLKKITLGRVRKVGGTSAIAHNAYYDNYYHWCAETLPRLFLINNNNPSLTLLLPENLPKFAKEYLQFFNFKKIEYIKTTELIKAEHLLVPMHPAEGLYHNGKLLYRMVEWLRVEANQKKTINLTNFQNIFISRSRAAYRRIVNEDEIIKIIKDYNFEIINLEDYSVVEQIAMLSQAKNVVAIHGAGLVNTMYMKAGGLVIDFVHENHYDSAFYNLASTLNIDCILMQCIAANTDTRGFAYDNFYVDPLKLISYFQKYLKN